MGWCEATTFGDLLVRSAEKYGSKEAIVVQDDRRSFESLLDSAVLAGRSLLGLGVGRGDAVGILMPNCIDFVEVMFGGALIGARVVPINARFKDRELAYLIENADLTTLLTSDIVDQHTDYVEIL
ncbi:MAG TPA: fatty acid--CoA ligase, partial [Acidimicrobiaceae bacterium]|nr:fatty acid--CoA ligase [Acidimicrobiaceae bacterium]